MRKKFFAWTLLSIAMFFFSCEDELDTGNNVTSDEAKLEINSLASQASEDIVQLTESQGVKGALDLLHLLEDFDFSARKEEVGKVREKLHLIAQYFVYGPSARVSSDDDAFTFDDIKGLYVWNAATEEFDKSASDFFIVQFPSEGANSNNAELKIADLELISIKEDFGDYVNIYQLPSVIDAYLKIDDVEVISLTYVVNWSSEGVPQKADVELVVSPFSFTLGFDQTFDEKSASLVTSIALNQVSILGVDVDVEFESAAKEEISSIDGFVQYYNLKVAGNVEVPTFEEEENGDINDFINLDLLLDDEKIGDILFEDDLAYVVYSDGSKELLEDIIQPVVDDLEEFFDDIEEDFD